MSGEEVVVHVNRGEKGSIDVAGVDGTFETRRSFALLLENHGDPVHVHCRFGGDLARVASIDKPNHYVDSDASTTVPVTVTPIEGPVSGTLELSTRYGAEQTTVEVTVAPPGGEAESVAVDESLARPRRAEAPPESQVDPLASLSESISELDAGTVGLLALGVVAIAIAAATAAVVGGTAAIVGFLVIAGGVGVAIGLLLQ